MQRPPPPPTQATRPRPVRYIIGALLALIILVGMIVLIAWLAVRPRKLTYSIEQGSISGFNLTDNHLNANFHFVLQANNPNRRISLYYDRIDVTVWYGIQKLSVNNVHSFYQRRRSVAHVDLNLAARDAGLYAAVAESLRNDRGSGNVELNVGIRAKIRLTIGASKIHRKLKVFCPSVNVPFSPSKGFHRVLCRADVD